MKRVLLAAGALICAYPALAADWTDASLEERHSGWSGAYLSGFAGVGITSGRASLHDYAGALLTLDVSNGLFPWSIEGTRAHGLIGAAAGYNFQTGAFVGGIEADFTYSWSRTNHAFSRVDPGPIFPGVDTNTTYGTDFGAIGTLRLRGGYDLGGTLFYATAGAAVGHVSNSLTLALPQLGYSSPQWGASGARFGYAIGVGLEHKVTSNVSLRLETMFVDLADTVVRATDPATFPGESFSYRFSNTIVMPRIGLTVNF